MQRTRTSQTPQDQLIEASPVTDGKQLPFGTTADTDIDFAGAKGVPKSFDA